MTFRRFAVSLVSVCVLLGCSEEDSVVALNITADDHVPVVAQLHVTITQSSRKFVHDFVPPTEPGMGDAGPSIQNSFFERITLPDDFVDGDASLHVEALEAGGVPFSPPITSDSTVGIVEGGAVAAYASLTFPAPPAPLPEPGEGGAGGEGGASDAGAPGNGGTGG